MTSKINLELELKLNLYLIFVAFIPFADVRSYRSDPSSQWNHQIFVAGEKSTFGFVLMCHNLPSQHNQHIPDHCLKIHQGRK